MKRQCLDLNSSWVNPGPLSVFVVDVWDEQSHIVFRLPQRGGYVHVAVVNSPEYKLYKLFVDPESSTEDLLAGIDMLADWNRGFYWLYEFAVNNPNVPDYVRTRIVLQYGNDPYLPL